ncbi:hypothetical protein K402DRAFT_406255 [Aulographum hederae CBS 113979]|uniref:Apple domain-containing protein n=1 Tax=Aulographum hederae CBS 113979 TaxID=1176131 RepID=A0A6G1GTP4_9PEZI|nr:hypothetical protein K402DRAFT_406255 [Aulographum hederae CBS 113979]
MASAMGKGLQLCLSSIFLAFLLFATISFAVPTSTAAISQPTASTTPLCPGSNGNYITGTNGYHYVLECGTYRSGYTFLNGTATSSPAFTGNDLASCVNFCDVTGGCVAVNYDPTTNLCRLKAYQSSTVIANATSQSASCLDCEALNPITNYPSDLCAYTAGATPPYTYDNVFVKDSVGHAYYQQAPQVAGVASTPVPLLISANASRTVRPCRHV